MVTTKTRKLKRYGYIIQTYVKDLGYRIDVASTGAEALERALHTHYDLFLLDISLPDMLGIDLIPTLQAHYGSKVLAIAITAHASDYAEDFFVDRGIPVTLAKPVSREELADALKTAAAIIKYMEEEP